MRLKFLRFFFIRVLSGLIFLKRESHHYFETLLEGTELCILLQERDVKSGKEHRRVLATKA